ncbi:MAG: hypothetical protein LC648_05115 [Novosphingobium sp.]|nr:hypothetical protein [Novosphingobium sp.]
MRLLQDDIADRGDLAPKTRRLFKLERLDRALQGRDALPDDASKLMRDTAPLDRLCLRALRLWGREVQKLRVKLGGMPYSEAFQPGRMRDLQAALIAELGYRLATGDASANGDNR